MLNYVIIVLKKYNFILTKWYVKPIIEITLCKTFFNFILTMWYVKKLGIIKLTEETRGFILTMWYVNMTRKFVEDLTAKVLY
ncbi:TPA: hypothetical protein KP562_002645 [Clostridioides difficile]|nr:hypothetical protein [Clostridioides difficile]